MKGGSPIDCRLSGVKPSLTNSVVTGMNVSWRGTASSPTRARKIQSRPGNFIHANAYAAKDAIVTGMITAGIESMKLLNSPRPRVVAGSIFGEFSSVDPDGGAKAGHPPPFGVSAGGGADAGKR